MARIPIFPPTYVTLTQVFPYVQVVNGSTPEVDVNGHFLPMSYQNTSNLYIDKHLIKGVSNFVDTQTLQITNECRNVFISDLLMPIQVKDTYAEIQVIMDSIDCNDLCTDA
mgnify:CR=1 FL=1|jgi:hypothetical protein|tara:strand:- start:4981 stop:5313 length:333 start_codon:yes stop_codon:yes gene_type:complete